METSGTRGLMPNRTNQMTYNFGIIYGLSDSQQEVRLYVKAKKMELSQSTPRKDGAATRSKRVEDSADSQLVEATQLRGHETLGD